MTAASFGICFTNEKIFSKLKPSSEKPFLFLLSKHVVEVSPIFSIYRFYASSTMEMTTRAAPSLFR